MMPDYRTHDLSICGLMFITLNERSAIPQISLFQMLSLRFLWSLHRSQLMMCYWSLWEELLPETEDSRAEIHFSQNISLSVALS